MGTVVEITLREENPVAANEAFSEIERLEAIFSSYIPQSDVSRISDSAGTGPLRVGPEVIEVLEVALNISELSQGTFDPTVGVLAELWDFSGEDGYVPSEEEVNDLLPLVDYKKLHVDKEGSMAGLAGAGMKLDLGGVAKGYIVGKAVEVLKRAGIERGRKSGELLAKVSVKQGAVATSGDYERFFIKDGVRYHQQAPTGSQPQYSSWGQTRV
jgi:thiamine biosynthesis lipoprotein